MAVKKIRIIGDDVLRQKCSQVNIIDNNIRHILKDMTDTLYSTRNGIALAAPQIGILKRLVVIDHDGPMKLVNPTILSRSGHQQSTEGCLSIPDTWGIVKRPYQVTVLYYTDGRQRKITATGDLAKCLCHEIDHLDGILFTDLMTQR